MTLDQARSAMCAAVADIRDMHASRATCCPTWSPTAIYDAAAAWRDAADAWYAAAVVLDAPESEWQLVADWDSEVQRHVCIAHWAELDAQTYGVY